MNEITFGEAFAYAMTKPSFWLQAVLFSLIAVIVIYKLFRNYSKTQSWEGAHTLILVVAIMVISAAWLIRPAEIKANTTKEQAAQGKFMW